MANIYILEVYFHILNTSLKYLKDTLNVYISWRMVEGTPQYFLNALVVERGQNRRRTHAGVPSNQSLIYIFEVFFRILYTSLKSLKDISKIYIYMLAKG